MFSSLSVERRGGTEKLTQQRGGKSPLFVFFLSLFSPPLFPLLSEGALFSSSFPLLCANGLSRRKEPLEGERASFSPSPPVAAAAPGGGRALFGLFFFHRRRRRRKSMLPLRLDRNPAGFYFAWGLGLCCARVAAGFAIRRRRQRRRVGKMCSGGRRWRRRDSEPPALSLSN